MENRWPQRFSARHPLFVAALVTVAAIAASDRGTGWGIGIALAAGCLGWWCQNWKLGLAWGFVGLFAAGVFFWRVAERNRDQAVLLAQPQQEVTGRILADAKGADGYWSGPVRLISTASSGKLVWWEGGGKAPVEGALVRGTGRFRELPVCRNPGEFDKGNWLRRKGVAAVFEAGREGNAVSTGKWAAFGARMRQGFRVALTAGLSETSQAARVIRAVVIGDVPPDADELVAAFRNSGTLHVFSVSGLHVAMVGAVGWLALRWLGVSRRWAVLVLLPFVFGYVWITGGSAPAVRSGWMAAVILGGFWFRRKPDLLNSLGAVLLVAMCWDGRLLFQPGVQLSYGVVAAIGIGVAAAEKIFKKLAEPELYVPLDQMTRWQAFSLWSRRKIAQYLSVSTAAWVGSTPLTLWHFGLVTPVSILSGALILPAVFGLLVTGLFSSALHPLFPSASRWINQGNGMLADATVWLAEGFSAIPCGNFQVRKDREAFLLVYDLEYGAGAACFSTADDGAMLVDCGDPMGFKTTVLPSLRKMGIAPDSVLLTHPDGRHLGGGTQVWESFPIRQVIMPVQRSRSPGYRAWQSDAPRAGVKLLPIKEGPLPIGKEAWIEVLNVPDPQGVNALADERVAVTRLHWRGWKLLLTSDAGARIEDGILKSGKDVSADVIICGRNRSGLMLGDVFLRAVNPRAIIASNAQFPVEERLPASQLAYWKTLGIRVMDQQNTGGVTLRITDDGDLRIEGFVDGSVVMLRPR